MVGQYVGVRRVEHRVLHRPVQQSLRVVQQVRIHRVICADQHHQCTLAAPARAPGLLPEAGDSAGEAAGYHYVQPADVDAQLQRVRRGNTQQLAIVEATLELAAILRGVARAICRHPHRIRAAPQRRQLLRGGDGHHLRPAPGAHESQRPRTLSDRQPHHVRGLGVRRPPYWRAVFALHVRQEPGLPQRDGPLARGRPVLRHRHHFRPSRQPARVRGWIHAGRGGQHDRRSRPAQPQQPPQHHRHVRAEHPAVHVALVDHHIAQRAQQPTPRLRIPQDRGVQHVRVRHNHPRLVADHPPRLGRSVAIVGGHHDVIQVRGARAHSRQRRPLVLRQGLRRRNIKGRRGARRSQVA